MCLDVVCMEGGFSQIRSNILLSMLVQNSRDQQGKLWLPKKQKMAWKIRNLTITFPSNASHKSLSTELLTP